MKESELQEKCNEILNELNIMYIHLEKGRSHKQTTHRKGIPDLLIFHNGNTFFVELKVGKGVLSKEQIAFREKAEKNYYKFYVCYSVDEFLAILDFEGLAILGVC